MNLYDFYKEAIELKEDIKIFEDEFSKLEGMINYSQKFIEEISNFILNNRLLGNDSTADISCKKVVSLAKMYQDKIREELRSIDFTDSIYEIANLNRKYKLITIDNFVDKYKNMCKKINVFLRNNEIISNEISYSKTIEYISECVDSYKSVKSYIDSLINASESLSLTKDNNSLKIRLLKEDNSLDQLIDNMSTINNIYNIVNSLVGNEEEKLEFRRVESGTFFVDFKGCVETLTVLLPILTFSYKIYTEQLSPKAKLDMELRKLEIEDKKIELKTKEIKARGEYIRLIKEAVPSNQIDFSKPDIQDKLLNLEVNLKKFYSDNPCIDINDEEYGVSSFKDNVIPIKLLDILGSDKEE
ncbi:MAG: hypothetical protein E7D69_09860 [Clostridium celatum]|jgi:hypothetical protein|nr:hypothetical protein [Clostridium celatum]MDU4326753.1 hypothetical protein [Clostridium celatum]